MKLRVADRVAGQFFNALDALMQRVAVETQPVGGPHHVAVLLQQRLEGLQQQPWRFTARLDQAAKGVVHKIVEQRRVADRGQQFDKPQLLIVADALGWPQGIAQIQRLARLRQRPRVTLQLPDRRGEAAEQRQTLLSVRQRLQPLL